MLAFLCLQARAGFEAEAGELRGASYRRVQWPSWMSRECLQTYPQKEVGANILLKHAQKTIQDGLQTSSFLRRAWPASGRPGPWRMFHYKLGGLMSPLRRRRQEEPGRPAVLVGAVSYHR